MPASNSSTVSHPETTNREAPSHLYRQILGIRFYVGSVAGLMERTQQGGLIVVPSAPVLVGLTSDPAHREAVEGGDFGLTDSGFMILLWWLFKQERLPRISGLRYLKELLLLPEFRKPGATFWVMPTAGDAAANRAWLETEGLRVPETSIYVAPHYARQGPLTDPALLAAIQTQRPQFIILNLGGGVQERLGYYLRNELRARSGGRGDQHPEAETTGSGKFALTAPRSSLPALSSPLPAIICTGAAIAFLSGRQTNIPPWADRFFLGWLMRILSEPTKFIPRYWHALRLMVLIMKHGERSVATATQQASKN